MSCSSGFRSRKRSVDKIRQDPKASHTSTGPSAWVNGDMQDLVHPSCDIRLPYAEGLGIRLQGLRFRASGLRM